MAAVKRLAVFDVDGTLIDSRRAIGDALGEAWSELGLTPPEYEQSRRIVGLNLAEAIQILAPELDPARLPELSLAYKNAFLRAREAGHREPLYDGALDLLRAMKDDGWLLGLATGKARRGYEFILGHHGVLDWFDCGFCADDGPGKPDPHMLACNMRHVDIASENTVMIGDTSWDMAMARSAGAYAMGVSWGFHTADEVRDGGAHDVVDDFASLSEALNRWRRTDQQQQQQQQQ